MGKTTKTKAKAKKTPAPAKGRWHLLPWLVSKSLKWATVVAVWAVIGLSGVFAWYATELPDVDRAFQASRRPSVTLLAADGSELAVIGDVYGRGVALNDVPPSLVHAVLATEDRRFYEHFGLDAFGLARAMVANLRAMRIVQGGSTITQQVAKNLFLTPDRTLKRKVQEVMLALWLERRFSKDQILALYLNRVYMGAGTYGMNAAAERYFGRPVTKVSAYQAAMLAGLLKAPSRYNPLNDAERARSRTAQVIRNMVAAGYLSQSEAAGLKPDGTQRLARREPQGGRHFADWVLEQVPDFVNPGESDIVVRTTLDPRLQRLAESSVARLIARRGAKLGVAQAALVAMMPAGAIRAMVGGRDYAKSQFNRATQAHRQPGSAFKPFVYLAALEAGLTPDSVLTDEPVEINGWRPRNFSGRHQGPVSMTDALAQSINSVAVRTSERVGRDRVIGMARRLGLSGAYSRIPSLALGVTDVTLLELTQAYAPFANGGHGVLAYGIEEIRDGAGHVLYRRRGSGPGRVVSDADVGAMNAMLKAVVTAGTGRKAAIGRPQAGKTGTSQNFRDAWFVGYTADLVTGVWMGNDDGRPMQGVTGGGAPARLWQGFMAAAHDGVPERPLPEYQPGFAVAPSAEETLDGSGLLQEFLANLMGR